MGINIGMARMNINYLDYNPATNKGLRGIEVLETMGISLGMITNKRLYNLLDLRYIPTVAIQQRNFVYYFGGDSTHVRRFESVYFDHPFMIKFKSWVYNNHRIYVMSGPKFSINFISDRRMREDPRLIRVERIDYSWEFAFGVDFYLFRAKLSPEIRYSLGIPNIIVPDKNPYGDAIKLISTQTLLFCLNFE